MNKRDIKDVLNHVDSGKYSPEEEEATKFWLFQLNQDKALNIAEDRLNEVSGLMWAGIEKRQHAKSESRKVWPLFARMAIAASFLLVIGLAWFFWKEQQKVKAENAYATDIAPGKNRAILTLADGTKIVLSADAKGKLAEQSGVNITKTLDGQVSYTVATDQDAILNSEPKYNTLSTAKGETFQLNLPDGSVVWLNAASSLTYTASLTEAGLRRVKLVGEAYFEVAKDKTHPFEVESNGQKVTVLGTHFNINSYADEGLIKTTLLEGSVKVSAKGVEKILAPGFEAVNSGRNIVMNKVDPELAVAWKNGFFIFKDNDLQTVMRQLSRWYDLDVEFKGPIPQGVFNGRVYRNMTLNEVLDILSFSKVNFKIEGKRMIIFS